MAPVVFGFGWFGVYQLMLVVSVVGCVLFLVLFLRCVCCFWLPSFPPSCWLHFRQMIRVFVSVFVPPFDQGSMWSTSALLGCCPCV